MKSLFFVSKYFMVTYDWTEQHRFALIGRHVPPVVAIVTVRLLRSADVTNTDLLRLGEY